MCGRVSQLEGWKKLAAFPSSSLKFFFFYSTTLMILSLLLGMEAGCMLGAGGVYVCEVGWGSGDHLEFFSITL